MKKIRNKKIVICSLSFKNLPDLSLEIKGIVIKEYGNKK